MKKLIQALFLALWAALAGRMARRQRRRAVVRVERPGEPIIPKSGRGLKRYLLRIAALVPVLIVGGLIVSALGIVSIKASSGHWAVTEWFLQFTKSRSIATYSMGISTPPLDDPVLVLRGAGHFETGCLPCHGGPEREHPRIARQMTPLPPLLSEIVPERRPRELFFVVKHGIKMTGMPAWPALTRDDEVWAVVAFLQQLPDMDGPTYRALVYGHADDDAEGDAADGDGDAADVEGNAAGGDGDPAGADAGPAGADDGPADGDAELGGGIGDGEALGIAGAGTGGRIEDAAAAGVQEIVDAENGDRGVDTTLAASAPLQGLVYPEEIPPAVSDRCGRCHGLDGSGRDVAAFPRLAGQRPQYLYASLRAYADGDRRSGIMQPVAAGLGDEEMRAIALYYSRMPTTPDPPATAEETASVLRGEEIAHEGIPYRRVPACVACHGPDLHPKNPFYPILAGQFADYIQLQLELFKGELRGGSAYAHLMHPTAEDLTEEQMRDVARYYASLGAELTSVAPADTTR